MSNKRATIQQGIFLILLVSFCITSCEDRQTKSQQPPPPQRQPPTQSMPDKNLLDDVIVIDIPLDDAPEGSTASTAMNVYFIFDGSGSMQDPPGRDCEGDQTFNAKIEGAKWAIGEFIKKVPPDVNIGLYVFSNDGRREVVPLGAGNHDKFLQAVNEIRAGRGTPLAESIKIGTDKLVAQYKRQLGYGQYRLVVVTDGEATGTPIPQAVKYATKYGIPIYTIGLCIGENHALREYSVSYQAADSFEDLKKGLEETIAELPMFDPTEFDEK